MARVVPHLRERPRRTALWTLDDGIVSFAAMGALAVGAQALARAEGLEPGRPVLVLDPPGPRLFATVIGLLGLGIPVLFVEPWMPVGDLAHAIDVARPQAFIGSTLALVWGAARVPALRRIPRWLRISRVRHPATSAPLETRDVDPGTPAVITFTSGTTGAPKGIVRSHGYLWALHELLTAGGTRDPFDAPDLCIFPNLALLHLASGRGAILVPPDWNLRAIAALPTELHPATLSCGPAFLERILQADTPRALHSLRSVYVGGAPIDCELLDSASRAWSDASITHVYGCTEAEPVAVGDARDALRQSRSRGLHQVLHIGGPIPEIDTVVAPEGLWVSGPNVAPRLTGGDGPPQRVDDAGQRWHCTRDRVVCDADGWWFAGRATQDAADFALEQRVYALVGTSACFVHRTPDGRVLLCGERLGRRFDARGVSLARAFPEIDAIRDVRVLRDRRHRARIDRAASLARSGYRDV